MTKFKILVSLVALFALGAGSGFVVANLRTNHANRFFTRWSDARIAEYRQLLHLSPAQEAAMRGHFAALAADYDELRADVHRRVTESIGRANTAIARDLTPEQRRLFWQHLREKTKRMEK